MSGDYQRGCREPDCEAKLNRWRSCPERSCGIDIAYCILHGKEERAVQEMEKHIKEAHPDV